MDEFTWELERQRVVDGRMSPSDLELFVECLDESPEQWRSLALAFVEEQAVRASYARSSSSRSAGSTRARRAARGWGVAAVAMAMLLCGLVGRWTAPRPSADSRPPIARDNRPGDVVLVQYPTAPPVPSSEPEAAPLVGEESRSVFERHGYDVSEERVVYLVETDNGERYVLPRRQVTLVSH